MFPESMKYLMLQKALDSQTKSVTFKKNIKVLFFFFFFSLVLESNAFIQVASVATS